LDAVVIALDPSPACSLGVHHRCIATQALVLPVPSRRLPKRELFAQKKTGELTMVW